jgi:hypothetical protein
MVDPPNPTSNDQGPGAPLNEAVATGNYIGPLSDDLHGKLVGICHSCTHRRGSLVCDAFPDGIPFAVLTGAFEHRKPYPGDHGIQWSAKETHTI